MKLSDIHYGDRVEIHPASDIFMRGVRYADVVKVGRKWVTCQSSMFGVRFKIQARDIVGIVGLSEDPER